MLWLAGMTPVACLAAWGACLVLGLEQAWLLAGFTGWGGFWGLPVLGCVPQVVAYSCVSATTWLGLAREADTDGWILVFIGAGDGAGAGSVAESWFCIITGLTLPILMGLSE